ncbi:hypothetical protein SCAR479_04605 [Seiridium cardinale]|uniref:Uncharacterized protein n=1 Tax=Seiridium cardinale TaxID=138064 RepID=A0ABR2XXP0_9PEZI
MTTKPVTYRWGGLMELSTSEAVYRLGGQQKGAEDAILTVTNKYDIYQRWKVANVTSTVKRVRSEDDDERDIFVRNDSEKLVRQTEHLRPPVQKRLWNRQSLITLL